MKRALALAVLLVAAAAHADGTGRDAGKHFQRGVDLYNDGDFRGALVEFKRAYEILPRANVLYDIGQTQYQLLDYAGALTSLTRYLAETGAGAPHRPEVEATVETLRQRVGRVQLASEDGCEVSVDEQPAGTTPLSSLVLSVGLRRVTVSCAGRPPVSRQVEVVAGERVDLELRPAPVARPIAAVAAAQHADATPTRRGPIAAWTVSALGLAAAVAVGATALVESSQLAALRGQYPVQRQALDDKAGLVNTLAITTDVVGACTLVAVGAAIWATVRYQKARRHLRLAATGVGVAF